MANQSSHRTGWFLAWVLVGVALAFGVLSIASVGIFVLPVAVIAGAVLALRPAARRQLAGAVVGAGLPLLYVAYLNRSGPGTVCTTHAGNQSCVDESNPWVWLTAALAIIAVGAFASFARRGDRGSA
jgi:hypothetical protein